MDHPLDLLLENTRTLGRSVIAQAPFLAVAAAAFIAILFLGRLARGVVRRTLGRYDAAFTEMVARLIYVSIVVLGLFVALWIAVPSVEFGQLFASLGVTGLILGFALRDIIENFVAGILILWRRPFRVGDQIRSGSYEGTVAEINFRSTLLRTYDGVRVYIPNGKVFSEPLENMTSNETRRSLVVLGVSQDASFAEARRVILETLAAIDDVLRDPPPMVVFAEVGDFANILHVLYWTSPPTRLAELTTRSLVTERLYTALPAAGITFPYPIQTLQLNAENGLVASSPPLGASSTVQARRGARSTEL